MATYRVNVWDLNDLVYPELRGKVCLSFRDKEKIVWYVDEFGGIHKKAYDCWMSPIVLGHVLNNLITRRV